MIGTALVLIRTRQEAIAREIDSLRRFGQCCLKEIHMDARNFTFMFYGFLSAWLIVLLYVVSLARRGARLKKELDDVKQLMASNGADASNPVRFEDRVR